MYILGSSLTFPICLTFFGNCLSIYTHLILYIFDNDSIWFLHILAVDGTCPRNFPACSRHFRRVASRLPQSLSGIVAPGRLPQAQKRGAGSGGSLPPGLHRIFSFSSLILPAGFSYKNAFTFS